MPLTLACVCTEAGVPLCTVTDVVLVVTGIRMPFGGTFKLKGGPDGEETASITTAGEHSLGVTWLAALTDTVYAYFSAERSLASDEVESFYVSFYVEVRFTCDDGAGAVSNQVGRMINSEADEDSCYESSSGEFRALGSLGAGVASGVIVHTAPLASCNGFTVQAGGFGPPFNAFQVIDASAAAGPVCLCASGGTAPYSYRIIDGNLPSGVTLDPDTGCLVGTPDGLAAGSDEVTFQVSDSTTNIPQTATATCTFLYCADTSGDGFGNQVF